MPTDNDDVVAQNEADNKRKEYTELINDIDSKLDLLNNRLSTDGVEGGTDEDSATDTAVTAAKVQTAAIQVRVDALFPVAS